MPRDLTARTAPAPTAPPRPTPRAPVPGRPLLPTLIGQLLPVVQPERALVVMGATHLRRCTYRHVAVDGAAEARRHGPTRYAVNCMHPTLEAPLALGGLAAAHSTCEACTLPGIFRADEA